MKWEEIQTKSPSVFKRLVGVHKTTFEVMASEIKDAKSVSKHKKMGIKRGPKGKLSIEDELLMLLMYYREYRTFLHISSDYGISEAQCWRIITSLEQILIKSEKFRLPGKKVLREEHHFEVILVDVTETPIERPQKNRSDIIQGKRKNIP